MLCVKRHRLAFFTGVEHLVQKLYRLFGAELDRAHACADEALLDDGDALFELGDLLLKCAIIFFGVRFLFAEREHRERALFGDIERGRIRDDHEKVFRHDVGRFREAFYEFDVLAYLNAHEVVEEARRIARRILSLRTTTPSRTSEIGKNSCVDLLLERGVSLVGILRLAYECFARGAYRHN